MLVSSTSAYAHMNTGFDRTNSTALGGEEDWARETISLLALSTIPGVGYWTLRKLAEAGLSFREIIRSSSSFEEFSTHFSQVSAKQPKKIAEDWSEMQKLIWSKGLTLYRRLEERAISVIHYKQIEFPNSLKRISEPPYWLFIQGDSSILRQRAVAIVGTREPSEDGKFLANYIGSCIPFFNAVSVSGLANGIDQIVHKNSIRYQVPTIAVLGTGIFKNYPSGSESLRYDICVNGGAIVTEYLPEQTYSSENFVRRNRLQAGLAEVLIPIEWKARSGTAHTVRFAYESEKKIVCLRMPDWQEKHHPEIVSAKERGAALFTVPGDESSLINYVSSNLSSTRQNLDEYASRRYGSVQASSCKVVSEGSEQPALRQNLSSDEEVNIQSQKNEENVELNEDSGYNSEQLRLF